MCKLYESEECGRYKETALCETGVKECDCCTVSCSAYVPEDAGED